MVYILPNPVRGPRGTRRAMELRPTGWHGPGEATPNAGDRGRRPSSAGAAVVVKGGRGDDGGEDGGGAGAGRGPGGEVQAYLILDVVPMLRMMFPDPIRIPMGRGRAEQVLASDPEPGAEIPLESRLTGARTPS